MFFYYSDEAVIQSQTQERSVNARFLSKNLVPGTVMTHIEVAVSCALFELKQKKANF